MSGRGGSLRDRYWRDNAPPYRVEEKSSGRNNPPSRHLWVGNLSHSIAEHDLTQHFVRFGELDTVAFQRGRSYAFINYKLTEDAIAAMRSLQGFPLAGNPLRIEFAKADKSSSASHGEEYPQRRDGNSSRARHQSPEAPYSDKSKTSDKSLEPSEVLWVGFPASLNVDEMILRKAFAPFGEIEKITTFPGRSYAFVRFRSVVSARKAKDSLHGRLFGNPRVHICFAKSESGSSNSGRSSTSASFKSSSRLGSAEKFQMDSGFRSPHFVSDYESGDLDVYNFNRDDSLWPGGKTTFERKRLREVDSELGLSQEVLEQHAWRVGERGSNIRETSERFNKKPPFYEDTWELPDDANIFHEAKKSKTSNFHLDKELPEYPLLDLEQEKRAYPRLRSDFPQTEAFDKSFELGPFGPKRIPDQPLSQGERMDHRISFYDTNRVGSSSSNLDRKQFTPEIERPSIKDWKWEGTIAKGGNPICRARCFPVGKVMDMILPEFLDCTARTSLDMLAKHYYQAAAAWVVFFVPERDAEIGFYNEFMHYLEEKQRAAVSRLDEDTTLFLVPPSEFSEKVLKVPGRLSISGVVLRLDHVGDTNYGSLHNANEGKDTNILSSQGNISYPPPGLPLGPYPASNSARNPSIPLNATLSTTPVSSGLVRSTGGLPDSYYENRLTNQENQRFEPEWQPYLQNAISSSRNTSQGSNTSIDHVVQERQAVMPSVVQQANSSNYTTQNPGFALSEGKLHNQEIKPSASTSLPSLQPEQLAQLASSLLGRQKQLDISPKSPVDDLRYSNVTNQSMSLQQHALPNNQTMSSASQFGQLQRQLPQPVPSVPAPQTVPQELQTVAQGSQQMQGPRGQEAEGDPQKRLQATLQLAAALLQQIQGKGN